MTDRPDVSPAERTDLAWQRTGLGLLSVSGLIGARALDSRAPSLLIVAGVAVVIGFVVLGVLAPMRYRLLRRHAAAAPSLVAGATIAVVVVAVAAGIAVLAVPLR